MKKICLCLMAAVFVLVMGGRFSAAGQAKYPLMFNMANPPNEPYYRAYEQWSNNVKARTNGDVDIELYTLSQLGIEEDIIEQIRGGANIGQSTDTARLSNYVPAIGVLNAPYFLDNAEEVDRFVQLDMVQEWKKQLEDKFGIKALAMNFVYGERHFMTNKPIRHPRDLAGMLIRTPGAPVWVESIRALGATPVALPRTEIYTSIQTRAIDGIDELYISFESNKLYELLNTVSETHDILLVNIPIVSAKWFATLPAEYQKILEEEAVKAGQQASEEIRRTEGGIRDYLKTQGITIIPREEIDIDAFKAAGERAYDVLKIREVRDAAYKALGKTK
ncbi:MAG: C4-dicarboxylate TRAP transporter substrate-binding protein [Planctomycetes bacterium]|nr:C4-dicarboxylate TRAP transporter substrate-binding protein [Planctomycetota bacterium]